MDDLTPADFPDGDSPADDDSLQRHLAAHDPVSDCPLVGGGRVELLPSGAEAIAAIFAAIDAARRYLLLEYYIIEDVSCRGERLFDRLIAALGRGVRVVLSYDGAGSIATPDALLDRLRQAGAVLFEFHPFSPFRRRFNPLTLNDRDHRKLLIADGEVAILGGVNLDRVYENSPDAGTPPDAARAFWRDCAARIEGPPVAEMQKLFLDNWRRQGGDSLPPGIDAPALPARGDHRIRTDGSAPREHRQLYFESLKAATAAARHHILLATGYFVPTYRQWRLLADAARRGVTVDLLLAGYSDTPSCTHAARALYGRLLQSGVRIHEVHDAMLHAKVATIDGVWTAIGSSNLDGRSFMFNNELDAIILGRATAGSVEAMLRGWMSTARPVTFAEWRTRSVHERVGELLARLWSRYM